LLDQTCTEVSNRAGESYYLITFNTDLSGLYKPAGTPELTYPDLLPRPEPPLPPAKCGGGAESDSSTNQLNTINEFFETEKVFTVTMRRVAEYLGSRLQSLIVIEFDPKNLYQIIHRWPVTAPGFKFFDRFASSGSVLVLLGDAFQVLIICTANHVQL
jgi:hypothetical protein